MFSQLLGNYLISRGIISNEQLREVLCEQATARVKLGTIAVTDKLLTNEQAEEINHLQTQMDKRFGDIAVEKGMLTKEQVELLLSKQGNSTMKFIQLLTEKKYVTLADLDKYLTEFQQAKGFTADEMKALKDDKIDELIPLFTVSSKPYVSDICGLVLRNIMRFVTTDFYVDRLKKVNGYEYSYIMGQKLVGDHSIILAFAANKDVKGIKVLASKFAKEEFTEINDVAMDAVCEFTNMNDGLFASEVSEKNVDIDMEPPFIYQNQCARGTAYILPLYVDGEELDVFIAVDSDVVVGNKQYEAVSKKSENSTKPEDGKTTVMIVDDSQLIRKMLRALLEENSYAVVGEATNGEEAVTEYNKIKPEIVTLDITMPKLDGVGALKQIMDKDKAAKIIMITAAGQKQKVMESLKLGAKAFIMKPFNKDDVLANFEKIK